MLKSFTLIFLLLVCGQGILATEVEREIVGQTGEYDVVLGKRTSIGINSANFKGEILKKIWIPFVTNMYKVQLDYKFNVLDQKSEIGNKDVFGVEDSLVPERFLNEEFLNELREVERVDFGKFKVRYVGKTDVEMKNGKVFKDCDEILVFKIDLDKPFNLFSVFGPTSKTGKIATGIVSRYYNKFYPMKKWYNWLKGKKGGELSKVKNPRVRLFVKPGMKFLAPVRIDLRGKADIGIVEASFEYTGPGSENSESEESSLELSHL